MAELPKLVVLDNIHFDTPTLLQLWLAMMMTSHSPKFLETYVQSGTSADETDVGVSHATTASLARRLSAVKKSLELFSGRH